MSLRTVEARIKVDDEVAFEKAEGPIDYLSRLFNTFKIHNIYLDEAFIADGDEDDDWYGYINYLAEWIYDHFDDSEQHPSPMTFALWRIVKHKCAK